MTNSELETFVTIKYGSIENMYADWIVGNTELTDEEIMLIADTTDSDFNKLKDLRKNLIDYLIP